MTLGGEILGVPGVSPSLHGGVEHLEHLFKGQVFRIGVPGKGLPPLGFIPMEHLEHLEHLFLEGQGRGCRHDLA